MTVTSGTKIRRLGAKDMAQVMAIETECFEEPWTEEEFFDCLHSPDWFGLVIEHDRRVVGFVIFQTKTITAIGSIAVATQHQRTGIGTELIEAVKRGSRCIKATVRERNLPAQLFLRSNGFRWVQTVDDYYDDEAGYVLFFKDWIDDKS